MGKCTFVVFLLLTALGGLVLLLRYLKAPE